MSRHEHMLESMIQFWTYREELMRKEALLMKKAQVEREAHNLAMNDEHESSEECH